MNYLCYLLVFLITWCSGRAQAYRHYSGPKTMAVMMGGGDIVSNSNLNNWLSKNGLNASDQFAINFGVRFMFAGLSKSIYGIQLGGIDSGKPSKSDIYLGILYGRVYNLSKFYLIPLVGFGLNTEVIDPSASIPPVLVQYKIPSGQLLEKELSINPSLMIHRHIENSFLGIGLEIGCRIYTFPSTWTYGGNGTGQNIKVSEVPNSSVFRPYLSVYVAVESRRRVIDQ